jgi:hypothetical protein
VTPHWLALAVFFMSGFAVGAALAWLTLLRRR